MTDGNARILTGSDSSSQTYAQWVARALAKARGANRSIISLFESSVPEPKTLLRDVVAGLVEPEFAATYASAFADGNPFVLDVLSRRYEVQRDQVLCTTGATGSLALLFRTFGHAGDRLLVETPGFDLFADLATDRGMQVDTFQRRAPSYGIDIAEIEALIRPDTTMIIISNLHNPSGMALDHDTLVELGAVAERRGVLLIIDEVYGDYAPTAVRPCPAMKVSPAAISVSSLTKNFGLATLRCGWIVAAPAIMTRVRETDARLEFGRSNLAHAVAAEIMCRPEQFEQYTADILTRSRPIVERWFAEACDEGLVSGKLPESGCIFFPRLCGVADSEAFANHLTEQFGVIVAPGEYFGAPGHVRIGFGMAPERLSAGLDILRLHLREWAATPSRASAMQASY